VTARQTKHICWLSGGRRVVAVGNICLDNPKLLFGSIDTDPRELAQPDLGRFPALVEKPRDPLRSAGSPGAIPFQRFRRMPREDPIRLQGIRFFTDSPDAGDPACVCSYCGERIEEQEDPCEDDPLN